MKKYRLKKDEHVKDVVNKIVKEFFSDNDPQGSYTGCPKDPFEVPVQDQDDL